MPTWKLIVVADREYVLPAGKDKSKAQEMLVEARDLIGASGVVTIADQLSLRGNDIVSVRIVETREASIGRAS